MIDLRYHVRCRNSSLNSKIEVDFSCESFLSHNKILWILLFVRIVFCQSMFLLSYTIISNFTNCYTKIDTLTWFNDVKLSSMYDGGYVLTRYLVTKLLLRVAISVSVIPKFQNENRLFLEVHDS